MRSGRTGTIKDPINDSKGCGGVMRMAPVGLFMASPKISCRFSESTAVLQAFEIGCELAALTHGHPTGYLAAGCLAVIILRIIEGDGLSDLVWENEQNQKKIPC